MFILPLEVLLHTTGPEASDDTGSNTLECCSAELGHISVSISLQGSTTKEFPSNRFFLAQSPGFFFFFKSSQLLGECWICRQQPGPKTCGDMFPWCCTRSPPEEVVEMACSASQQATNPQETWMALGWGAEGAMLAVECPLAGGQARVRGVSPGSGHTARSQCGPAPPALQAVGCLALPGTKREPQRSPPVLRMLVCFQAPVCSR